jgi:hypothetical protein
MPRGECTSSPEITLTVSDFDKCATINNTGYKPKLIDAGIADPYLDPQVAAENIKREYHAVHNPSEGSVYSIATLHRDPKVVGLHLKSIFKEYEVTEGDGYTTHINDKGGEFRLKAFYLSKDGSREPVPVYVAYLPSYGENGNDMEQYHANQKLVGDKVLMIDTIKGKLATRHGILDPTVNFFDDKRSNTDAVFSNTGYNCYWVDHREDVTTEFKAYQLHSLPDSEEIQIDKRMCRLDGNPTETYKYNNVALFAAAPAIQAIAPNIACRA